MPKVIRPRKLVTAGEVEIPDLRIPIPPTEEDGEPEEVLTEPAAPVPDPGLQTEELLRQRLEQMQRQAEETSGKILRHAGEERSKILEEARQQAEQLRQEAYQQAYRDVVEEKRRTIESLLSSLEEQMQNMEKQQSDYLARYEKVLPELALDIAEKIMASAIEADPLVLKPLVQRAVSQVKNADWLEVQVSQQVPQLVEQLEEELSSWTDARHAEVKAEAGLEAGSCVVQTPQGIIDASVSTQLANLARRLKTAGQD